MSSWRAMVAVATNAIHRQFLRPADLAGMVVAPFVLALVFGYVDANRVTSLPVGLVVEQRSTATDRVADVLEDKGALRIRRLESTAEAVEAIERGELDGVLVAGGGLEPAFRWIAAGDDERGRAAAVMVETAVITERSGSMGAAVTEILEEVRGAHPTGFAQSAPALLAFFAVSNGVATGILLLDERRRGVLARLKATPHSRAVIVSGVVAGRLAFFVLQIATLVVASTVVFGISWGNPVGVAATCGALAFVGTSFAVVLATLPTAEPSVVSGGGLAVSILTGVLGGCFWPLWISPAWLRAISRVTPQAWAIDAYERLGSRGADLLDVAAPLGVLGAFGAVLAAVAWAQLGRSLTEA